MNPTLPPKGHNLRNDNPRYKKSKKLEKKSSQKSMKSGFFHKILDRKTSTRSFRMPSAEMVRKETLGNDSLNTQASFFDNVAKVGGTMLRKTRSLMSMRNIHKSKSKDFFQKYSTNKWRAERSAVFTCDEDEDNCPTHIEWRGYSFCVSQNRLEGVKPEGQDAIGVAVHGDWEVIVLCDGHDQDGHLVAQGICACLPNFLLRRVISTQGQFPFNMAEDSAFVEAFAEAEETVCWEQNMELEQGDCVKVLNGDLVGEIGYVATVDDGEDSADEEEGPITIVIDNEEVGYNRRNEFEKNLATPRYKGGCTCLCLLRNFKSNRCKVAVLGDSRLMVLGDIGSKHRDEDFVDPVLMTTYLDFEVDNESVLAEDFLEVADEETTAFFTPQHNVHNPSERERLKAYQKRMNGQYVVNLEQGYLVNPETKMQIQPTRGFGDVEMQSAGYSHEPEISAEFTLSADSVVVGASDGIFDGELWSNDEDFMKHVYFQNKSNKTALLLNREIYENTTKKFDDASKLDDISMFTFITPHMRRKYTRRNNKPKKISGRKSFEMTSARLKRSFKSRGMKSRRSTIRRADIPGAHLFRNFFSKRSLREDLEKENE